MQTQEKETSLCGQRGTWCNQKNCHSGHGVEYNFDCWPTMSGSCKALAKMLEQDACAQFCDQTQGCYGATWGYDDHRCFRLGKPTSGPDLDQCDASTSYAAYTAKRASPPSMMQTQEKETSLCGQRGTWCGQKNCHSGHGVEYNFDCWPTMSGSCEALAKTLEQDACAQFCDQTQGCFGATWGYDDHRCFRLGKPTSGPDLDKCEASTSYAAYTAKRAKT